MSTGYVTSNTNRGAQMFWSEITGTTQPEPARTRLTYDDLRRVVREIQAEGVRGRPQVREILEDRGIAASNERLARILREQQIPQARQSEMEQPRTVAALHLPLPVTTVTQIMAALESAYPAAELLLTIDGALLTVEAVT